MTPSAMTSSARARAAADLRDIQAPVRAGLDQVAGELWRIVTTDLPLVLEINAHLAGMKGKMFRPTLVLLASAAEGRPQDRAVPIAAALEALHLASLVHDDAVDHSVLRRGMPTVNALFSHQHAVLMGDFLYARALTELVRLNDWDVARIFADASTQITLGEMRQLGALDALAFGEGDYDQLIRAKTASLFRAATELGALCGAVAHRSALARYGERLGMAFQVVDDLLDYTEDAEVTGKPSGLDLREHKVTLPLIAALPEFDAGSRRRVEALFVTPDPEDAQVAEVVELVGRHGGLDYARRRAEVLAREAEASLASVPETPARAALADAVGYVLERRA